MTSLIFSVFLSAAAVTDGDGAPAGMTAQQEEQWAWQHLPSIVVKAAAPAKHLDGKARTPFGKKKTKKPPLAAAQ